jgi:signal transduction histidine kinase
MTQIRKGVADIRSGGKRRLDPDVPTEVNPLVSELNALLDSQEKEMRRAHDRAADLAHGLKTPLTALAADVRALRKIGQAELADNIEQVAERMRSHVERELVAARLRYGPAAASLEIAPAVDAVIHTLRRIPGGDDIFIETDLETGLSARISREDLCEITGNLGENAVRHCKSRVRISSWIDEQTVHLRIEDDGEGVAPDKRAEVTGRGKRLDERGGAAGLGLAIVQDILDQIEGRLELDRSELGGLSATVILPKV